MALCVPLSLSLPFPLTQLMHKCEHEQMDPHRPDHVPITHMCCHHRDGTVCLTNTTIMNLSCVIKFRWFDIRSKISFSYKINNVVLIIVPAFHDCTVTRCGQISLYHFIRKFLMSFIVCYSKQISVTPLDMQLRMHPEIQVSASDWLTSILKGAEEDWKPDLVVSPLTQS